MGVLSNYLRAKLETAGRAEEDAWLFVRTALANGEHLEAALEGKALPDTLLAKIVGLTWQCLNEKDTALLSLAASNEGEIALGRLLSGIINSTLHDLNVVIPTMIVSQSSPAIPKECFSRPVSLQAMSRSGRAPAA